MSHGNYSYNGGGNYAPYRNNNNNRNQFVQNARQGHVQQDYKKKSGCSTKQGKKKSGEDYRVTYGWKYFKGFGITKYFCFEYKGSAVYESKNGTRWLTVMCEAHNLKSNTRDLKPALMDLRDGRVICKAMGLVLNPKGGKGGVVARIGAGK